MLFSFELVCVLFLLGRSSAFVEKQIESESDCSVLLRTANGVETCPARQCDEVVDPLRVIDTRIHGQPCYLHHLKLAFSTYHHLHLFVDMQQESERSLDSFFANDSSRQSLLKIAVSQMYPLSQDYLLSERMLNRLGGRRGKINRLQLKVLSWSESVRPLAQRIENDLINRQPFRRIVIYYPCHARRSIERLVLVKHTGYQERSSCPTQILVVGGEHLLANATKATMHRRMERSSSDEYIYNSRAVPSSAVQPARVANRFTFDNFDSTPDIDDVPTSPHLQARNMDRSSFGDFQYKYAGRNSLDVEDWQNRQRVEHQNTGRRYFLQIAAAGCALLIIVVLIVYYRCYSTR